MNAEEIIDALADLLRPKLGGASSNLNELLSVNQVRLELGVRHEEAKRLIKAGIIKAARGVRGPKVSRRELERYTSAQKA